jgi:hypothetical protein
MNKLLKLMNSDKAVHFLYCFFLTSIGMWLIPFGWLLGVLFAIGKEAYDIHKRGFDKDNVLDIVADILGIALAYVILGV